jgi:inner membrane protein
VHLAAKFGPAQLEHILGEKSGYRRDAATLRLPLSDLRGLREVVAVRINGEARALEPSAGVAELPAVEVKLVPADLQRELTAEFTLRIAGTERLEFLPLARVSSLDASGPWGDPGFVGAPLPAQREVRDGRFSAHWQALDLNRGYRQQWVEGDGPAPTLGSAAFGVNLYEPASLYLQNTRAGKYGLLFVALTFVAFFLFEVLKKLRVHPLQYLLVGLALSTFYLVLLALSEQVGFAAAYAAAAGAVVLMIAGYAAAVLATWRAGAVLGAVLAAVYALLYFLVSSEAYSLLTGALALLGVVGLLMFLTRRVDWYAYARPTHG